MNTVAIDSNTYREVEAFARLNHLDVAEVVKTSIQNFLKKFQVAKSKSLVQNLGMPAHLEMLGGCLSDVADEHDEKLNYLLEKYK